MLALTWNIRSAKLPTECSYTFLLAVQHAMLRLSEERKANPWADAFLLHTWVRGNIGAHFHTKGSGMMQRQKVSEAERHKVAMPKGKIYRGSKTDTLRDTERDQEARKHTHKHTQTDRHTHTHTFTHTYTHAHTLPLRCSRAQVPPWAHTRLPLDA